jgi:hypothetical protein
MLVKRFYLTLFTILPAVAIVPVSGQNIISSSVMMMVTDDTTKVTIAESKTPTQCRTAVRQETNKLFALVQDSTKHFTYDSVTARQKGLYKQCTDKFAGSSLSVKELLVLSEMYAWNEDDKASTATAERAVKLADSDADRALALEAAIKAVMWRNKTTAEGYAKAAEYTKRIDALSNDVIKFKIAAHMSLASAATDTATAVSEAERARDIAKGAPSSLRHDS